LKGSLQKTNVNGKAAEVEVYQNAENLKEKFAAMDCIHFTRLLAVTLLDKIPRTKNSERKFRESRLFSGTNLILRPE